MTSIRKYANLPDLDLAPDVYETPELTDDGSSIPTNAYRSDSPHSPTSGPDEQGGIIRQRIHQDEARSRFLSDEERREFLPTRIGAKRNVHHGFEKSWTVDTDGILNGVSGPDDGSQEESVARKLTRLRREILELQSQIEEENEGRSSTADPKEQSEAESLSALLDAAESTQTKTQKSAASRLLDTVSASQKSAIPSTAGSAVKSVPSTGAVTAKSGESSFDENSHFIVARIDARLKALEDALGLDAIPAHGPDGVPIKPLLPALDTLDRQYTTLSTTSETSIEKIRDRVRELTNDASTLEIKRSQAKKALEDLNTAQTRARSKSGSLPDGVPKIDITEDPEQVLKINALYGTLGTIDSMAPILPSVLERLRSLRDLHANAATASQDLSELEKEQEELAGELRMWKQGVERVEKAILESRDTLKENTEVVEEWVQELEQRVKGLK